MKNNTNGKLAIFGGKRTIGDDTRDIFAWPIITEEDEQEVLKVLRRGAMSETDVTCEFEREFSRWQARKYALATNNGTSAIHSAMYGCGIGVGDEIISQSLTYWGSILQCYSLGATVVFADVEAESLCIDPNDIERKISKNTKAILVVHYLGYPSNMDAIMEIARRYNLKIIEDVSHAQGGLYRGRKVGTFGDAAAMSLMSGKSFAIGEAGILVTDEVEIYERAIAFGHYERYGDSVRTENLREAAGLPLGGYKYRIHQLSSAVGRVQLRYYDQRMAEIDKAMNYFWDCLAEVPGIKAHRPPRGSGSTMAGWYSPHGIYAAEELDGLSISRFCEAVRAEGYPACFPGVNTPLHLHPLFNSYDVYGHGKPTRLAHAQGDVRQSRGSLPVTEKMMERTFSIPWFKRFRPQIIDQYVEAFKKVAQHAGELIEEDRGNPPGIGDWNLSTQDSTHH